MKPRINNAKIIQKQEIGKFLIVSYGDITSNYDKNYKYVVEVTDQTTGCAIMWVTMEREVENKGKYHILLYKNGRQKQLNRVGDVGYGFFIGDANAAVQENVPEFSDPIWIDNQTSIQQDYFNGVFFGFETRPTKTFN